MFCFLIYLLFFKFHFQAEKQSVRLKGAMFELQNVSSVYILYDTMHTVIEN